MHVAFRQYVMDESLKIRLLKAVGNDVVMQAMLSSMMESTQAEFCAFYTARDRELAYIMIESHELSLRIPELRDKLVNAYRMFTNGPGISEEEPIERIFCRRKGSNVAYLVSNSKIESYFLVPVIFASKVRAVLYFGSTRKEAFGRNDIAAFRSLADEGEETVPLVFRVGGEKEILERLLAVMPQGAALVSPDGRIVGANRAFGGILRIEGDPPENLYEIGRVSCFNLHGIWEEFSILQKNVMDRELEGTCIPERCLSVSWVRLDDLSEDVGSLVLIRDATPAREQAEAREEMVALVAHELRTPLSALKNSLGIIEQGNPANAARFISNATRTIDRLGRLVDSLLDSSSARIDERPLVVRSHDVNKYLEEISAIFLEPMRRKGIDFAIRTNCDCSSLTFDGERIEQVLQNLLANSIKHVPSGGTIAISVSPCDVCPPQIIPPVLLRRIPRVAFADLCIRDSGSGIPPDIAGRINLADDGSGRPAKRSKGLGLIIAKRLVRMHGGSLVIEEEMGDGSAVHLFLPVDSETAGIVQRYRSLEARFVEMLAKGLTPAVWCVSKNADESWPDAVREWRPTPMINPPRSETPDRVALLWPLSDQFALALSARIDCTGAAQARCAVGPREGTDLNALLSTALERMERVDLAPVMKGVDR
jgi:signal transduction histidine kinase